MFFRIKVVIKRIIGWSLDVKKKNLQLCDSLVKRVSFDSWRSTRLWFLDALLKGTGAVISQPPLW